MQQFQRELERYWHSDDTAGTHVVSIGLEVRLRRNAEEMQPARANND